jgi:hypothetical protein
VPQEEVVAMQPDRSVTLAVLTHLLARVTFGLGCVVGPCLLVLTMVFLWSGLGHAFRGDLVMALGVVAMAGVFALLTGIVVLIADAARGIFRGEAERRAERTRERLRR